MLLSSFREHLTRLNPQQQTAVTTTEGRVLVLAGAGTGKTSVLTHRIAYLILERGVDASSILGLTFTNKAASEMRSRLAFLIGTKLCRQVTLSTFHSFTMQLLREQIHRLGYTKEFSLYTERDVKRLLDQIARHILALEGELPSLAPTQRWISMAKQRGLSEEELLSQEGIWHDRFARDVYTQLTVAMRAYNAVDFDSLLTLTVELFERHPDVLADYQNRFRYLLIDEYQDTNPIQDRLAALLTAQHRNLCVVGDDDQSIYGWRGAAVRNILEFHPDILIKLEQNYRSTPMILTAANRVIQQNEHRHNKVLWSARPPGEMLTLFHAADGREEATAVVERMIWLYKQRQIPWGEMAVLYRSNILSRDVEVALSEALWEDQGKWRRGIPYVVFGGTEFSERTEIRDVMAFLRVVANPRDQEALLRIINVPRRGIAQQSLDLLTQLQRKEHRPLWELLLAASRHEILPDLAPTARKGIQSLVDLLMRAREAFASRPLEEALDQLLEEVDYQKAIAEEVRSDAMRAFKWENVQLCRRTLQQYREEKEGATLIDFLSNTTLDDETFQRVRKEVGENRVHLMTFHSAKGLEFTACFLIGVEERLIPHEKSLAETGIEEERRLFYVALTRAKSLLTLSMARQRKRMGRVENSAPSPFLLELPKETFRIVPSQAIQYP